MKMILCIVCAITVLMIPATGRSLTFTTDTLLTGTAPTSPQPWLTLTFTGTEAANTVRFTVTAGVELPSEFISNIVFNVDPAIVPSSIIFGTPTKIGTFTNPIITQTTQNAQSLSPADNFDILLAFSTSNANRFNNNDSITYVLTAPGLTENSFNFFNTEPQAEYSGFYAVAKFQGIPTGEGSGKLGDSVNGVPEPSTLLLLGAGLVGFGIWGRRKFRS